MLCHGTRVHTCTHSEQEINPVAGGTDEPGQQKERLLKIFGKWADSVTDLIRATPEPDVIRRDIFDRPPIFKWTDGHVALLGDSAHAMQPNLGQVWVPGKGAPAHMFVKPGHMWLTRGGSL